jgi:hypothetical protein
MYGRLNIGGRNFIERFWTYTNITTLTANEITTTNIVLDGEADFLLKLNTCSSTGSFRIRLGTSDSGIWFSSAGNALGGGNNRVLSTLFFGNGQFPFPVVPHIWFPRTAAIIMDLEDVSGFGNTLEFAFHGSKLIPEV